MDRFQPRLDLLNKMTSPSTPFVIPDSLKNMNWEEEFAKDGVTANEMFKKFPTSLTYKFVFYLSKHSNSYFQ